MTAEGARIIWHRRRVLGWQVGRLLGGAAVLCAALWGLWLTREVLTLKERRIVSVSLQSLIEHYVAETAQEGVGEEEAQRRTRAYLAAVEAVVASLNDGRTTVLVSEAVIGKTAPDITPAVEAAVARALAQGRAGGTGHGR